MRYVLLLLFICNASPNAFAQHVGIKNDVLWDAAMMPNLGVELSMNRHVTVDLWGGGECWDAVGYKWPTDRQEKHLVHPISFLE